MTQYTVALRPSISGVRVLWWREAHRPRNTKATYVPWKVAAYLELMPNDAGWTEFRNVLYGLTNKQLAEMKTTASQRVTRRKGVTYVTFTP